MSIDGCCDGVCQLSVFLWPTGGWIIVFMSSRIEAFSFAVAHCFSVLKCMSARLEAWLSGIVVVAYCALFRGEVAAPFWYRGLIQQMCLLSYLCLSGPATLLRYYLTSLLCLY